MNKHSFLQLSGNFLFILAFFEGVAVMAVELCSAQIISPFYGNNLAVWTTVLGVTLIALTTGYFSGGRLPLNSDSRVQLGWLLLSIALCISSVPFIGSKIIFLLDRISWQSGWVLMSVLIIAPSLFLLGMLPPMLINLLARENNASGKISGQVFGISTMGNIFSAFLVGFALIPVAGVSITLLVVSMLISGLALGMVFQKEKTMALIFFSAIVLLNIHNIRKPKAPASSGYRIVDFSEGLLGQLAVIDIALWDDNQPAGWDRIMLQNRIGQTYVNLESGNSRWSYVNFITSISSVFPDNSKVLLFGLGGGTVAKMLNNTMGMEVTAVELDRRIAETATKRFGLPPDVKIIIDDARHFLKFNTRNALSSPRYSIIIFDTFQGDTPPAHLLSEECFAEAKKLLEKNGMLIINFYGFIHGSKARVAKSLVKTLEQNGFMVSLIPTIEEEQYRNILLIASENPVSFNQARAALNIFGKPANLDSLKFSLREDELADAAVLSDNQPIQELWNIQPSRSWRQDYYNNITRRMLEEGVPLFK